MNEQRVHEQRVRRRARKHRCRIIKRREWEHVPNLDKSGEYMLLNENFQPGGTRELSSFQLLGEFEDIRGAF